MNFKSLQNKMFASFQQCQYGLVNLSYCPHDSGNRIFHEIFEVFRCHVLGRDQAINLGVDYDFVTKRVLIVVTILISISTALIGPITFLGLLVANVAYQFIKSYQHKHIIPGAMLISVIALVGGQFIVERIFTFSTTLSVIINFVGGVYFIYLLLKENKSW